MNLPISLLLLNNDKDTAHRFDEFVVSIYHCSVMLARLPEYIDPLHLADKRGELKGQIPVSSLDRLADLLFDETGAVTMDLFFGREGRLAKIEGYMEAVLELECQNCLQAVPWPVKHTVKLGIVTSIDQADRLPEDYEPLLVVEGKMPLKNIVEDELLLILPAFPRHSHNCLAHKSGNKEADFALNEQQSPTKNPFSILAKFKNTGDL
ncbi:MAG: YceD family protein [Methylobacter sp.]|uniref:Large ribosomal RNA subunit accumulation protein YceD n=1 Tax=Candidatus Methylobacter titanis TaxID=3053457 RepID=A0AA43Q6R9_9GAMM|nr:YceD family protein [Candidatus Methylobacter titanis]